jgi:hypothetical protein
MAPVKRHSRPVRRNGSTAPASLVGAALMMDLAIRNVMRGCPGVGTIVRHSGMRLQSAIADLRRRPGIHTPGGGYGFRARKSAPRNDAVFVIHHAPTQEPAAAWLRTDFQEKQIILTKAPWLTGPVNRFSDELSPTVNWLWASFPSTSLRARSNP